MKIRLARLYAFASAIALALLPALVPAEAAAQVNKNLPVVELTITQGATTAKLKAEVAADGNSRTIGLMNRFSLAPDSGMLFVFARAEPLAFWMRNTYVPLSIAYLNDKGVILNILDMKPHDESTHPSAGPAMYALEMKQGWFKERGIVAGARIGGLDKAGRAKD
ncbi:MAG: DUF192 domain-containing protein [Burkholderiales bacterium]|nr:DUF192 domain-containing protein [Burkholderiales bacterium]